MKRRMATFITGLILALTGLIVTPSIAHADVCASCYGGLVVNQSGSNKYIPIWNGSSTLLLQPGYVSSWYTYYRDVDGFAVMSGCTETSQWGYVYTSHGYNVYWYYIPDSANLSLYTHCNW